MQLFKKQQQQTESKSLGIYIHIPFCRSKCEYCDFYSLGGARNKELFTQYQKALADHFKEAGKRAPDHVVDTVYFGGGTPSFFGADRLCEVLGELGKRFHIAKDAEITLEANPDSLTVNGLNRLKRGGFNRISIGVQSDNDDILRSLGRPHNFQHAKEAVENARAAGFDNLSIDLMFGLPTQTKSGWATCLKNAVDLKPDHISAYALTIQEGTPLYEYQDAIILPDDDAQADMYLYCVDMLESSGYQQYEISNFCLPGRESKHNLKYWKTGEYMGFGPSAASDFGSRRYTYVSDLNAYIKGVAEQGIIVSECEDVPLRERAGEYLMLRLRLAEGIEEEEYRKTFLMPFDRIEELMNQYETEGWAEKNDGRWRLTPQGMLISNRLIGELIDYQAEAIPQVRRY